MLCFENAIYLGNRSLILGFSSPFAPALLVLASYLVLALFCLALDFRFPHDIPTVICSWFERAMDAIHEYSGQTDSCQEVGSFHQQSQMLDEDDDLYEFWSTPIGALSSCRNEAIYDRVPLAAFKAFAESELRRILRVLNQSRVATVRLNVEGFMRIGSPTTFELLEITAGGETTNYREEIRSELDDVRLGSQVVLASRARQDYSISTAFSRADSILSTCSSIGLGFSYSVAYRPVVRACQVVLETVAIPTTFTRNSIFFMNRALEYACDTSIPSFIHQGTSAVLRTGYDVAYNPIVRVGHMAVQTSMIPSRVLKFSRAEFDAAVCCVRYLVSEMTANLSSIRGTSQKAPANLRNDDDVDAKTNSDANTTLTYRNDDDIDANTNTDANTTLNYRNDDDVDANTNTNANTTPNLRNDDDVDANTNTDANTTTDHGSSGTEPQSDTTLIEDEKELFIKRSAVAACRISYDMVYPRLVRTCRTVLSAAAIPKQVADYTLTELYAARCIAGSLVSKIISPRPKELNNEELLDHHAANLKSDELESSDKCLSDKDTLAPAEKPDLIAKDSTLADLEVISTNQQPSCQNEKLVSLA